MNAIQAVDVYYFSGTGNAKKIAEWTQLLAKEDGIACSVQNISHAHPSACKPKDSTTLLLFVSPTHGFNYPPITLHFLWHFPRGRNPVVLMNTRAGMRIGNWVTPGLSGITFLLGTILLVAKGYSIRGAIPFDMPSNWISLHPALGHRTVQLLHKHNYGRLQHFCKQLFAEKRVFPSKWDLLQDLLISPIAFAYYLLGRFAIAKTFYASTACNNCGKCARQCPVQAIETVRNRPFWKFSCESCMQCMNHCPHRAIETSHALLLGAVLLAGAVNTVLAGWAIAHQLHSEWSDWLLYNLLFFGLLGLGYRVQHWLLGLPVLGSVISFLSLTHWRWWGRYRALPDSAWKIETPQDASAAPKL